MKKNKFLLLGAVSLYSVGAIAEIDLSFNLNIIPTTPQISILRVQPVVPYNAPARAAAISVAPLPPLAPNPQGLEKRMLVSPKVMVLPVFKVEKVLPAKIIFDPKAKNAVTQVKPLENVADPILKADNVSLTSLIDISNEEYKMIQGLLLAEMQKKYDLALSVFAEVLDDARFKYQAQYLYGEMAQKLGLVNEFRHKMLQLTKQTEDKVFRKKAVESLVLNADAIRTEDVNALDPLIAEYGVDLTNRDGYQLKRAKQNLLEGDLSTAEAALHKISAESVKFPEATLLKANSSYRRGEVATAISSLEKAGPKIDQLLKRSDKVRNLIYLTLARMQFQKGNYKGSYASYLKIDKSSPLWLQSTTEQALTQILAGDNIGAAGNMFSLHTDFFKKAYAPETYIIRTVGYLNLCQYGDAASALVDLSRRYGKILEQLQSFKAHTPQAADYYTLVKDWIANTEQNEVKGVPRSYIVELARHPNFLNLQKQINSFEEDLQKFSALMASYPGKEQGLRKNITQLKSEIAANRAKRANDIQVEHMEKRIAAMDLEQQIASRAPQKIEKMKALAAARMQPEKEKIKVAAGTALQKRFNSFLTALTAILEQKDVLAYEIYSGAGEHLRYQMAGGKANDRNPAAALTPEEKQSYKWKFRGEVWEDEIGHYRSSLTNVCPDQIAKNAGGN